MKSPYEIVADIINKHTFVVAGIVTAILIVALYGASMTSIETGTETYLFTDRPVGSLLVHYEEIFGADSIILIIEGDDVTTPDVLNYIEELEKDISDERYIRSVAGLPDLIKGASGGEIPQSQAEINNYLDYLSENSGDYLDTLLPSKMMTLVSIPLETGYPEGSEENIVKNVHSAIIQSSPPPGISVTETGTLAFAVEMKEDIQKNMTNLISLALLLMVVAMVLMFGHVRYRMLPVLTVFCGIILTFGVMGLTGIQVSMAVVAAFPILIGIGIDYAIQFQSRFDEEVRNSSIQEAIWTTITSSGPAILKAMIATALGFVALSLLAPSPMISDFGTICIVGIVCCYLCAMIIVPVFAKIVKYTPKTGGLNPLDQAESCQLDWKGCDVPPDVKPGTKGSFMDKYDDLLGKFALKIAKNPVPVLLVLIMVAIIGMQFDSKVIIDTDEDMMVDQDMPAMVSMNKLTSVMGSTNTITAYVKADSVKDYHTLKYMDNFGEYAISKHPELTGMQSIVTYIKQYNGGVLPEDKKTLEKIWDSLPGSIVDSYVNGNTEAVIEFSLEDLTIPETQELISDMEDDLNWYVLHPGMDITYTGKYVMFVDLINGISDTKNPMTYLGLILISLFLLVVYRRFTAISPVIPIIMIVGWNGLIMYSLGLSYSLLTATLGAMTIGIASEYTILILERYEEERDKGNDLYSAIQTAIQKIGTAITVSGLTTVFGFSALLLSTSPIIQNFGLVTVITVGFSLVGAIVVMPAVISVMDRLKPKGLPG
ncbi:efflux RND transporter permease subunit [Methanolacinia paynteri]|uniref:efflux RND transporter permease subunit n=1 Tax=Methanolacinia paynteri TaxID=230356 RepID=UPI00064E7D41|nr:hydrophobe/amphiphile efflux-3 (HAE3) family transporter [Methanolacinia paynteri]